MQYTTAGRRAAHHGKPRRELASVHVDAERGHRRRRPRDQRHVPHLPLERVPELRAPRRASATYSTANRTSATSRRKVRQHGDRGRPKPWANLKTSVGGDYTNVETDGESAQGRGLAPGASSARRHVHLRHFQRAGANGGQDARLLRPGAGRVFAIGCSSPARFARTRTARSASNFQHVVYPKVSVSWLMSDESFFPKFGTGSTRSASAARTARTACSRARRPALADLLGCHDEPVEGRHRRRPRISRA